MTNAVEIISEYKKGKREFCEAYLFGANLIGANLSGANLSEADLFGANLSGANLSEANLSEANLSEANLSEANLTGANLYGANLYGANLFGADLSEANLFGANLPGFQIPDGMLIGWKKLKDGLIAELTIPWKAKRTASLVGRKCRAEYAYVTAIHKNTGRVYVGYSQYDNMEYTTDLIVRPDSYDDDIRVECSHGIHFFMTRKEAEDYVL